MPEWDGVDRVTADDLEIVDPATLEPHPDNPRVHDDATIGASIEAHGVIDVCVVQRSRRRILGGNGRWENATARGALGMPVLWVDCDDDEAEEIMLVLNAAADRAAYDPGSLVSVLERIRASGRPLAPTGYDDTRFHDLVASLRAPSLDELTAEHGQHGAEMAWPIVRFTLPPTVFARWEAALAQRTGETHERVAGILDALEP